MPVKRLKNLAVIALALLAIILLAVAIRELVLTQRQIFNVVAQQLDGSDFEVQVTEIKKGFFISGGHGWSIGSNKRSYSLTCSFNKQRLNWEGPGIPIILQREGNALFLATFDRDTDFPRTDFLCYEWSGDWKLIPTAEFPKRLTVSNNLMRLDVASGSSDQDEFAASLLVRFWYCVARRVREWEVAESDVTKTFIESYRKDMNSK